MPRFRPHYQGFDHCSVFSEAFWHTASEVLWSMIRITTQSAGSRTVVTIDGHVAESDLKEIHRVRKSASGAVVLNLRGLDGCAAGGVRLLRAWLDGGAKLQDATPFLRMILESKQTLKPNAKQ
jgi:hypothetical protein